VAELYGYLGIPTNTRPEYAALWRFWSTPAKEGAATLRILSDSELLVRQIRGEYRVKAPGLLVLHAAPRPPDGVAPVRRRRTVLASGTWRPMPSPTAHGPSRQLRPASAALRDLPPLPFQPRLH